MSKPGKREAPDPALSFGAFPEAIIFDVDGTLYTKTNSALLCLWNLSSF
jgi:hypothetical protein